MPPGWRGAVHATGALLLRARRGAERARPDHAPGHARRAARGVRGDGRGAGPLGALGQHQGAPRRLDRALRRPRARWSCRPSTSPSTSARCRPRSPPSSTRSTRPSAPGSSTTPTAAARTCPTSRSSRPCSRRRRAARLRRQPRAPRRRRRRACPARCPPTRRRWTRRGVVIAPRPLDDAAIDELAAQMRQPAQRRADLRAQLAANRAGVERMSALAERGGSGPLREAMDAVLDYAERRTRACLEALPDGTREAADVLEAADGDLELRARGHRRGRPARARLHRLGAPARGQPQLPARGHRARRATSPCACSPIPTSRPAPAPTARSRSSRRRARLLNARAPGRRGGRQRRDLLARRRPGPRRLRPRARARGR